MSKQKTAITPTRQENYAEWYQQVIQAADLAENSPVRGCMVIKQWGYGIWEKIQKELDRRIKLTGHDNVYFPLFIPLSFLEKEAGHVEGFAKECAVVTHHRLEIQDGKMIPVGKLEEPLVVRPTSETLIGHSFSKWIHSHRDLPLKINQWANVVRWEMRTRMFLRSSEFLWQEGHTAHATKEEAEAETKLMLQQYIEFATEHLAIPSIAGVKTSSEKFPGADDTYCFEMMMQDKKALQAGTSHYLGQNFSKAFDIQFTNQHGEIENAYTTSWGVTTRLIGALIMVHADDDGMRVPPKVAPKQIVIIPFLTNPEIDEDVLNYCYKLEAELRSVNYNGSALEVFIDKRDLRGGEKNWQWIKKGVPVRIEIGPRDIISANVCLKRRDKNHQEKNIYSCEEVMNNIVSILDDIQNNYYLQAKEMLEGNISTDIENYEDMVKFFTPKNVNQPEIHGGFVNAKWCGDEACERQLDEHKVSIRCLPLKQSGSKGVCIVCGEEATTDAIYAKAY